MQSSFNHSYLLFTILCLSHIQPRAPYDFYYPNDFLPVRPSEMPVGILNVGAVLMVTSGYGHRTAWHGCILMVWLNNSHVRAPYGNLQCFSYPTGPVRGPQGCRTPPLRTRKGIDTTRIGKNPARASYFAVRGHRLFKISKPVRGP